MKQHARSLLWPLVYGSCFAYFAARPSGLGQLAVMVGGLAAIIHFLGSTWRAVLGFRKSGALGFVAPTAILIAVPLGVLFGGAARETIFEHTLSRYVAASEWASARALPNEVVVAHPPAEYSDLATIIHIRKNDACGLMIDFFWGGGFPVKHVVRRYAPLAAAVELPQCREGWYRGSELAPSWYELSD